MCCKASQTNKFACRLINRVVALLEVYVIHVDVTCSSNLLSYEVKGIIDSSSSRIMASLSEFYDAFSSVLGAKASTIFEGIRLVNKMSITQILVLFESFTMIQILKEISAPLLEVVNQVANIKSLLPLFRSVSFQYV